MRPTRLLRRTIPALGRTTVPAILGLGLLLAAEGVASAQSHGHEAQSENEMIAMHLAGVLRAARAVISDSQPVINDRTRGDKGITGQVVLEAAKMNFRMMEGEHLTHFDMDNLDASTRPGQLVKALFDSIIEVMDGVQDRINRKSVAFKGFLPSIFTAEVAKRFKAKVGRMAEIRITAPANYIRNRANSPDKWEHEVIENRFRSPEHPVGHHVSETTLKGGRQAYRMIVPEYYKLSCLACHGEPKGRRDITGNRKEGAKLSELGGAISIVIYL